MFTTTILSALMALLIVALAATDPNSNGGGEPLEMYFLGTVEGKSFFYENNVKRNWTAAWDFCNATGLHLASFDTEAQIEFVTTSTVDGFSDDWGYWTSGRDSNVETQFTWDDTNSTVGLFGRTFQPKIAYASCLLLIKYNTYGVFAPQACADARNTLCET